MMVNIMYFLNLLIPFFLLNTAIVFSGLSEQDFEQEVFFENEDDGYDTPHSLHFRRGHSISIGPEIYRVNRDRDGRAKQKGNSAGIRATYDHIKRYRLYLGAQLFYGTGILRGHTNGDDKIRSRYTEKQIEGNVGYTFQTKCFPHVSFTPFTGYGYFRDVTKFSPPSALKVKFTTQFRYISFGFLSSAYVLPYMTVGINARFKWPWQTRCKVTDDPDFDTIRQIVDDQLHYRIEIPVTYFGCFLRDHFEFAIVPFFEQRRYGARENFPFDFFKTTFTLYGANLQLIYRF